MNDINIFAQSLWNPLGYFGIYKESLVVNAHTIINTWLVIVIILVLSVILRLILTKKTVGRFLILQYTRSFVDLCLQTLGHFHYGHISFIFSLFIFILFCNWAAIIPWATEPTQDLNTAIAVSLISFFYKEFYTIRVHGLSGYINEFLQPFFVMLPINVIGHFSKIISLSFRLFGNIFGGAIIMELYTHLLHISVLLEIFGLLSGTNFLILSAFGVFEGLIQAFVFMMLSLTYLALAIQPHEDH